MVRSLSSVRTWSEVRVNGSEASEANAHSGSSIVVPFKSVNPFKGAREKEITHSIGSRSTSLTAEILFPRPLVPRVNPIGIFTGISLDFHPEGKLAGISTLSIFWEGWMATESIKYSTSLLLESMRTHRFPPSSNSKRSVFFSTCFCTFTIPLTRGPMATDSKEPIGRVAPGTTVTLRSTSLFKS